MGMASPPERPPSPMNTIVRSNRSILSCMAGVACCSLRSRSSAFRCSNPPSEIWGGSARSHQGFLCGCNRYKQRWYMIDLPILGMDGIHQQFVYPAFQKVLDGLQVFFRQVDAGMTLKTKTMTFVEKFLICLVRSTGFTVIPVLFMRYA